MIEVNIGDTIIVLVEKRFNNGADTAPAMVNRAWEQAGIWRSVNCRVLLDGEDIAWWTSVPVYASEEAARAEWNGIDKRAFLRPAPDIVIQ